MASSNIKLSDFYTKWLAYLVRVAPLGQGNSMKPFVRLKRRHITGEPGFEKQIDSLAREWKTHGSSQDILAAWNAVDIDEDFLGRIRGLRRLGVPCYLASNQQTLRANWMSNALGYKDIFDAEYYSCDLGVGKPQIEFFERILSDLGCRPENILFLDDRQENVAAASRLGFRAYVCSAASVRLQNCIYDVWHDLS